MAFIFQKVGRGTAEMFKVLKNGTTSALPGGSAVCYDYTTDANGKTVILPAAATLQLFAGVVAHGKTLAKSGNDGQWGKVQIYGHHGGIIVAGSSLVPGSPLVPIAATGYMGLGLTHTAATSSANAEIHFAVAGTTACIAASSVYSTTTTLTCIAFIRAM